MGIGMGEVGAWSCPQVSDQLSDPKRQQGAESGGRYSVASVDRPPLATNEEEHRQQRRKHVLGVEREETQRVLKAVMPRGQAVEYLVKREVDGKHAGSTPGRQRNCECCGDERHKHKPTAGIPESVWQRGAKESRDHQRG